MSWPLSGLTTAVAPFKIHLWPGFSRENADGKNGLLALPLPATSQIIVVLAICCQRMIDIRLWSGGMNPAKRTKRTCDSGTNAG